MDQRPFRVLLIMLILTFGVKAHSGFDGCSQRLSDFRVIRGETTPESPALQKLYAEADRTLLLPLQAVTDKVKLPPSADPHDYQSLSIYWWPNPWTANGLPYIEKDGQRNPEAQEFDEPRIQAMIQSVHTLALAAFYSRDARYAQRAITWIEHWFLKPETAMNPHLKYGQSIPGLFNGTRQGIIETVGLANKVLNAVALLEEFAPDLRSRLRPWIRDYRQWLDTSILGALEKDRDNNHGTYFDLQMACYALFLDEPEVARKILEQRSLKRLDQQFAKDGSQPQELKRTRSFDYSLYNLQAWFQLAALAEQVGLDLWHYRSEKGVTLQSSVDFLANFAEKGTSWPYEQITPYSYARLVPYLTVAATRFEAPRYLQLRASLGVDESSWRNRRESLLPGL